MNAQLKAREKAAARATAKPVSTGLLQRKCSYGDHAIAGSHRTEHSQHGEPRLQRAAVDSETRQHVPPIVNDVLCSPGQPLEVSTRAFFEPRFGRDFSGIRVHTDARAAESAGAVNALAYAVGQSIVFGAGQYSPETAGGRRLLAHELAHVLQQSTAYSAGGSPTPSHAGIRLAGSAPRGPEETEAERISTAALESKPTPSFSHYPLSLQREAASSAPATVREARQAELFCDIPTLCRLRRLATATVSDERIRATAQRCRPGVVLLAGDPCLSPAFMLSPGAYTSTPPARTAPSTAPPATAGGGGLGGSLEELTSFSFSLGSTRFEVTLPSSVTSRLPIPLRGSRTLEFVLTAETSGNFSFAIRINGLRHVQIEATAGVEVGETSRGTAGLTISTTRTVCRAMEPTVAREQLEAKGIQLRDAIRNLQSPPAPEPGAERVETSERLVDVVSAIADLYGTIERAQAPCEQVPVVSFGLSGGMLLGEQEPVPLEPGREREPAGSVSGGVTLHF